MSQELNLPKRSRMEKGISVTTPHISAFGNIVISRHQQEPPHLHRNIPFGLTIVMVSNQGLQSERIRCWGSSYRPAAQYPRPPAPPPPQKNPQMGSPQNGVPRPLEN